MGHDRRLADLLRTERARRIHERLLVVGAVGLVALAIGSVRLVRKDIGVQP